MKNIVMKIVGLFKIKMDFGLSSRLKWIIFWIGIAILLFVAVFFFWANATHITGITKSDKPNSNEAKQEVAVEGNGGNSSPQDKPPMSTVKFFEQAHTKDDNSLIIIVLVLLAGGMIGYVIYSNKDNIV